MYSVELRKALLAHLHPSWLVFMPKWNVQRLGRWLGPGQVPNALMLHHTAACATSSTNPNVAGNRKGANDGVINYIQTHYEVPAANFTLDRDGTIYVHSSQAVWHAGLGSFRGKSPWVALGIPDNTANNYTFGVEIMSKGLVKDYTEAQKDSLVYLLRACRDASDWANISVLRRPQHRDWTTRKVDLKYTNAEVSEWIRTH